MLSIPPAFILSQNQTLKFNCLKSSLSLKSNNGSNFVISLLTCFKVPKHFSCSSYFEKLTEITFLFALCQIKSHFFLIPFLICFDLSHSLGLTAISRGELVYNNTSQKTCQAIFSTFLKIFGNFFEKLIFACCFRDSLYNIAPFLL